MATASQVKALIRSHAEGDETRFYAIALQVAAQAARSGHNHFATELRELVDRASISSKRRRTPGSTQILTPRIGGKLDALLATTFPKVSLSEMALDKDVRSRIERVLLEQRQRDRIQQHGLMPLRRLLLIGPPGTGKTMTASVFAAELGLPLCTIQLDGLITKFMGETSAKLRLIFDAIEQERGVYFFDEFDALGGERGAKNDVGEIRRVLNSFLQFIEHDESGSLVIAATNHVALLDRALFRRFDAIIEYPFPDAAIAERVMRSRLSLLNTPNVDWRAAIKAADGLSHADIARACEHAVKNAILENTTVVGTEELIEALNERRATYG